MATSLYMKANETGAKAQNEEFLASDIIPGVGAGKANDYIVEIAISAGTSPNIDVTYDGGATFSEIIFALGTDVLARTRLSVVLGDQVNFRTTTVGGLTLSRFVVIGDVNG